ncbi:MAG: hypothetical protein AAF289_07900 [Cyanobacteria bacterium P01_A01_bin.135]
MKFDSQSDKPPPGGDPWFVNVVGTAIALLTLLVPLATITMASLSEPWTPPYGTLLPDE